jgi:hypothetical protein
LSQVDVFCIEVQVHDLECLFLFLLNPCAQNGGNFPIKILLRCLMYELYKNNFAKFITKNICDIYIDKPQCERPKIQILYFSH